MKTLKTNEVMKKYTYLLTEQDPDGRTGEVKTTLVAILGADTKEEIERLALRTIVKYNANSDFTRIAAIESRMTAEDRSIVHDALMSAESDISLAISEGFFFLQPIEMQEWPRRGNIDFSRHMLYLVQDATTRDYRQVSDEEIENGCDAVAVDIVDIEAMDSPFIYASPFRVKEGRLYAVDAESGEESGPYDKAEWDYMFYVVSRCGRAGLVSLSGRQIADCIYDYAYCMNGIAMIGKDGKAGFYSPEHDVLIPCEYDEIECMPEDRVYIMATKDGVQGLIATDGTFHPETDEDPDDSYEYL